MVSSLNPGSTFKEYQSPKKDFNGIIEWERTRDFSQFPYPEVPLTEEEKKSVVDSDYIKFQTPNYMAYVHYTKQDYVTPLHLVNPSDSEGMRRARESMWGRLSGVENYEIRSKYERELLIVIDEMNEIDRQHIRDNPEFYGDDLIRKISNLEEKYSLRNFIWISLMDLAKDSLLKVRHVALSRLVAISDYFYKFLNQ